MLREGEERVTERLGTGIFGGNDNERGEWVHFFPALRTFWKLKWLHLEHLPGDHGAASAASLEASQQGLSRQVVEGLSTQGQGREGLSHPDVLESSLWLPGPEAGSLGAPVSCVLLWGADQHGGA